jgi:hypothetical protein
MYFIILCINFIQSVGNMRWHRISAIFNLPVPENPCDLQNWSNLPTSPPIVQWNLDRSTPSSIRSIGKMARQDLHLRTSIVSVHHVNALDCAAWFLTCGQDKKFIPILHTSEHQCMISRLRQNPSLKFSLRLSYPGCSDSG